MTTDESDAVVDTPSKSLVVGLRSWKKCCPVIRQLLGPGQAVRSGMARLARACGFGPFTDCPSVSWCL